MIDLPSVKLLFLVIFLFTWHPMLLIALVAFVYSVISPARRELFRRVAVFCGSAVLINIALIVIRGWAFTLPFVD